MKTALYAECANRPSDLQRSATFSKKQALLMRLTDEVMPLLLIEYCLIRVVWMKRVIQTVKRTTRSTE